MTPPTHTPLHELETGHEYVTGGRLRRCDEPNDDSQQKSAWHLVNAHGDIRLRLEAVSSHALEPGQLVRVRGECRRSEFHVDELTIEQTPAAEHPPTTDSERVWRIRATRRRTAMRQAARKWFDHRDFLEVRTAHALPSPGTDPYIEPFELVSASDRNCDDARASRRWLHTSPEFAMKRLLADGFERIYQLCRVWRGGDDSPRHAREFSMLEWYRAWAEGADIRRDVASLVRHLVGPEATVVEDGVDGRTERTVDLEQPIEQVTMQHVVQQACGFDILDALGANELFEVCQRRKLISERALERFERQSEDAPRWDELFFQLQVDHIDPWLSERGAIFVTDWPTPLGILAKKDDQNPDVAKRFELYIGGVELANGFAELTDPDEQRRRFERDLATRRSRDRRSLPMPTQFLDVLETGLPPSAGVAVGFDRLLMLDTGVSTIDQIAAPQP